MKTVILIYESEQDAKEAGRKTPAPVTIICQTTTEAEHQQLANRYPLQNRALDLCWWISDSKADEIAREAEEQQERLGYSAADSDWGSIF